PALTQLGLPAISAHMFIFYFGLVSAITPPVALAAYAAASISGAGANETAVESIRLGFVKLLVPFLFVTMPGILMIGTPLQIVLGIVFAAIAVTAITIAFAGWMVRPISGLEPFILCLNRMGFPSVDFCDSRCWLERRPASDDSTSFQ
ncbi:MAG: TRAP transporter large permease subunit, partial [Devosia sp.]